MKYTITINQRAAVENFGDTALDIVDFALIEFIGYWAALDSTRKTVEDGRVWFWLKWTVISQQMPILRLTTRKGVAGRVGKLCDAGFLSAHPENQTNGQAFYALGKNWELYNSRPNNESAKPATPSHLLTNANTLPPNGYTLPPNGYTTCNQVVTPPVTDGLHNKNIEDKYTNNNTSPNGDVNGKKNPTQKKWDLRADLSARNLHKVALIAEMPTAEKYSELLQTHGDAYFWEICEKLNEWLLNKKGKPYTHFAKVFSDWAISEKGRDALAGLNKAWRAAFKTLYKDAGDLTKGEKIAIEQIGKFVEAKYADDMSCELPEKVAKFFADMPAKWKRLEWFKLTDIAANLPAIYAAITTAPQQQAQKPVGYGDVVDPDGTIHRRDGTVEVSRERFRKQGLFFENIKGL